MYLCTACWNMSLSLCSLLCGYGKFHQTHEQRQHHLSSMVSSIGDVAVDIKPSHTTHKLVAGRAGAASTVERRVMGWMPSSQATVSHVRTTN
jgi:hypothetical protein